MAAGNQPITASEESKAREEIVRSTSCESILDLVISSKLPIVVLQNGVL